LLFASNKKIRNYGFILLLVLIVVGGVFAKTKVKFSDNDSKARLAQWQMALKGFKDQPVLGTGPENYYVVSNKYFNPEIYKYDASWFDKPHNALLESLITTGILGLLSYLSIIVSAFWMLWRSFRQGILRLPEFTILLGGLVAYEVQNFFVFDTISASLMFFVFLGVIGCLVPQIEPGKFKQINSKFRKLALSSISLISMFLIYFVTLLPARASYYTQKGIIYTKDISQARDYFDRAQNTTLSTPQLGDIGDVYEQSAVNAVNNSTLDKNRVIDNLSDAINLWERVTNKTSNIPYYWLKLANLYYAKAFMLNGDPELKHKSQEAAAEALKLVPQRVEPLPLLAKLKLADNKIPEAEQIIGRLMDVIPQNTNSAWHYKYRKEALSVYDLLIRYYASKQDYGKVLELYQLEINRLDPYNPQLYSGLAATYAKLGDKAKAIEAAKKVIELQPAAEQDTLKFIESLK
jgi:tetratricopeptide (TPR) repeat protein